MNGNILRAQFTLLNAHAIFVEPVEFRRAFTDAQASKGQPNSRSGEDAIVARLKRLGLPSPGWLVGHIAVRIAVDRHFDRLSDEAVRKLSGLTHDAIADESVGESRGARLIAEYKRNPVDLEVLRVSRPALADALQALRAYHIEHAVLARPESETKAAFLKRAAEHYDQETARSNQRGQKRFRPHPEMLQHAKWYCRRQIDRVSWSKIAEDEKHVSDWRVVRAGARRFAKLLDFPCR